MSTTNQVKSREYSRIPFEMRKELIRLVMEEKLTIKEGCEKLRINYSTGKLTVKKFQKEGRITRFADQVDPQSQKTHSLDRQNHQGFQLADKVKQKFNPNQFYTHELATNSNPFYLFPQYSWDFYCPPVIFQHENLVDFSTVALQPYRIVFWSN